MLLPAAAGGSGGAYFKPPGMFRVGIPSPCVILLKIPWLYPCAPAARSLLLRVLFCLRDALVLRGSVPACYFVFILSRAVSPLPKEGAERWESGLPGSPPGWGLAEGCSHPGTSLPQFPRLCMVQGGKVQPPPGRCHAD